MQTNARHCEDGDTRESEPGKGQFSVRRTPHAKAGTPGDSHANTYRKRTVQAHTGATLTMKVTVHPAKTSQLMSTNVENENAAELGEE